jgi:predicted ester cyclase
MATTAEIAKRYFDALSGHDLDAAVAVWAPGGVDRFVGQQELTAPDGIREYFSELFAAFPDFAFETVDLTTYRNRTAVRWRAWGTFAGPQVAGARLGGIKRLVLGHADAITGNVRAQLELAASAPL